MTGARSPLKPKPASVEPISFRADYDSFSAGVVATVGVAKTCGVGSSPDIGLFPDAVAVSTNYAAPPYQKDAVATQPSETASQRKSADTKAPIDLKGDDSTTPIDFNDTTALTAYDARPRKRWSWDSEEEAVYDRTRFDSTFG